MLGVLALSLAVPVGLRAQAKPNFTGTWTLDMTKSDPPPARGGGGGGGGGQGGGGGAAAAAGGGGQGGGGGRGGGGQMLVIAQTASDITINMVTYKLDGSTQTVQLPGRGGATQEAKATAKWNGNTLAIETTRDVNGMTIKVTDERTLSADGKEITDNQTTVNANGEAKRKIVFTKS